MSTQANTSIAALFPDTVSSAEVDPSLLREVIYPEEEALVHEAHPKRRQTFIAGRVCARRVLAELGITDSPLLIGNNRAPLWPEGIVGSIAHTEKCCGVVAARQEAVASLGLDIESQSRMHSGLWSEMCNPEELSWLETVPHAERQAMATVIFSAKESLYKCQHPLSSCWVGFMDAAISINRKASTFDARFLIDIDDYFRKGYQLTGRFLLGTDLVYTGLTLPPSLLPTRSSIQEATPK